ncbi:MAG: DUF6797 domain-containing protein [Planctomycetaceae bacterium]
MVPRIALSSRLPLTSLCWLLIGLCSGISAQSLDERLRQTPITELVTRAKTEGDAARGAVVFFQQQMACSKCHSVGGTLLSSLGPDLATLTKETTDAALVESVLTPSKVIRKGFESVTLVTGNGQSVVGILAERTAEKIVIRDVTRNGEMATYAIADLDNVVENPVSIMPAGQMNQLASPQQFFDLIRYLMEIRDGGALRAKELQPSAALLTLKIPEYEQHIDHAGFIREWDDDAFKRGEAIYRRVCQNCHGTQDKAGSLPTSLKFASGKFRSGSDPYTMYQTLTKGFGLMAAQTWMVPSQKYDVIHYIRESYLKPHNPSQFIEINEALLAKLPKGDTRGPEPSRIQPWNAMDYGPSLTHSYEVPGGEFNIAYKGIAMRLDPGAGGVSRGRYWMMFDTDTLRMAAAWSAADPPSAEQNFIDWRGIQFNGEHQIHPTVTGTVLAANPNGPGWADPSTGEFTDEQRVLGRDERRYGPLPKSWGRFRGTYYHGQNVILSYSVGSTDVLEMPSIQISDEPSRPQLFLRTFNIGPRDQDLILQVAQREGAVGERLGVSPPSDAQSAVVEQEKADDTWRADAQPLAGGAIWFGSDTANASEPTESLPVRFDGQTYLEVRDASDFDMTQDFTITARVKTRGNGTIFANTKPDSKWVPDGQALFIADGHLTFDIGWVGAVSSKKKINDGRWHDVAAVWTKSNQRLTLFVDGKPNGQGQLAAKARLLESVVRVGFTSANFPESDSFLTGELDEVRFYKAALQQELRTADWRNERSEDLVAHWDLSKATGSAIQDKSKNAHDAMVVRGDAPAAQQTPLLAGLAPTTIDATWSSEEGRLLLRIPAGPEPLRFTLWMTTEADSGQQSPVILNSEQDLQEMTSGGPARWNQKITTTATIGSSEGPFATDVLTAPENNPWLAQTRFTGLDFFEDGRIAVCSWDGDVWLVDGFLTGDQLTWQRIASGLYQPLGLKIVHGKIHLTCRDQLAVLHDLNGDEEIDYFECLNNDHQVTEHFHEFAMGLQTDADGNFYYAKSGRHALEAVVPHHGTLLKVSKDGSTTEILANGFRAANGVCLNPDGSFVVTDQEGFWNPKNRINWVTLSNNRKPKFYGNMFGYHDVTDSSDDAMEPPLCWITNAFDRSPGELLWVNSDRWGPLNGALLNLSYGYGKVFLVPHESVTVKKTTGTNQQMQGGMIELPIPTFPTGVMRGRFHPADGQLYLCGMFAWAGSATTPGGLYRLRATGQPMHLPTELHANTKGMELRFTEPLKADALKADDVQLKVWSLKRTANYGSEHYDEHPLEVEGLELSNDGRTLTVLADIEPTWCMEIRYTLQAADGKTITGTIHNTVHATATEP